MEPRPRTFAFYLPQFHPIPENDRWWGKGFTEWTNVRKSAPSFTGHYQPQVPLEDLGYYDLTDIRVIEKQARLARDHDVDGFVFYHYWFDGDRLLERPLDELLGSSIELDFAICWANENWTRRWDGKEHEILIQQNYDVDCAERVFDSFVPYLRDERYITIEGRKLIVVHRVDHIPHPSQFAATWRARAQELGIGPLYLAASETSAGMRPARYGFDAIVEFPPVGDNGLSTVELGAPEGLDPEFSGRLQSYPKIVRKYMSRRTPGFVRHPGVIPKWDNTPRRGKQATLYLDSSPGLYAKWLAHARHREATSRGDHGAVFINAWNEWAEGAYLEPDSRTGFDFLRATRWDGPEAVPPTGTTRPSRRKWIDVSRLARAVGSSIKGAYSRVKR